MAFTQTKPKVASCSPVLSPIRLSSFSVIRPTVADLDLSTQTIDTKGFYNIDGENIIQSMLPNLESPAGQTVRGILGNSVLSAKTTFKGMGELGNQALGLLLDIGTIAIFRYIP